MGEAASGHEDHPAIEGLKCGHGATGQPPHTRYIPQERRRLVAWLAEQLEPYGLSPHVQGPEHAVSLNVLTLRSRRGRFVACVLAPQAQTWAWVWGEGWALGTDPRAVAPDCGADEFMTSWIVLGSKTLPAAPDSVAQARQFTAETLPIADRSDTAVLLISERFTNSALHSNSRFGGEITVMLFDVGGTLRGEVIDEGAPTVPTRREGREPRDHGYGILLIEDLADRSGHFTDDAGYLHAWFEID